LAPVIPPSSLRPSRPAIQLARHGPAHFIARSPSQNFFQEETALSTQKPTAAPSTLQITRRYLDVTSRGAYDELADLYAEDAVIEIPFAPPGIQRTSQGREVFRARFKSAERMWQIEGTDHVSIHQSVDPEVVVVEFTLRRRLRESGKQVSSLYIVVMTIRDGLIRHSRDYADIIAGARALGRLHELIGNDDTDAE
jgi:ketosteroid isomerase-like protein